VTYKGYADKKARKSYLKVYMRDYRKEQKAEQEREMRKQKLAIIENLLEMKYVPFSRTP
jgi:hypothetical protein